MDNIDNDELSGGSNKGNIDGRMGGNKNEGIQNNDTNYNHKNDNSSLSEIICSECKKNLRSLMIKIRNYVAYAVKI